MRILQEEAYRERVTTFWNNRARTYDANDTFHPPLASYVVDFADLRPGMAVLDVATGTGTVAFAALDRIGSVGKVIGVDISESMVDKVRPIFVEALLSVRASANACNCLSVLRF
jgi:ubiquinone/menaquinone biosynthesis C-methylase UbiE